MSWHFIITTLGRGPSMEFIAASEATGAGGSSLELDIRLTSLHFLTAATFKTQKYICLTYPLSFRLWGCLGESWKSKTHRWESGLNTAGSQSHHRCWFDWQLLVCPHILNTFGTGDKTLLNDKVFLESRRPSICIFFFFNTKASFWAGDTPNSDHCWLWSWRV